LHIITNKIEFPKPKLRVKKSARVKASPIIEKIDA
jgi:hypothetical protein